MEFGCLWHPLSPLPGLDEIPETSATHRRQTVEAILAVCSEARLLDQEKSLSHHEHFMLGSECLGSGRLWLPEGTRSLALAAGI